MLRCLCEVNSIASQYWWAISLALVNENWDCQCLFCVWSTLVPLCVHQIPLAGISLPSWVFLPVCCCSVEWCRSWVKVQCHGRLIHGGNWWTFFNSLGEFLSPLVPLNHLNLFCRLLLLNRFPFPSTHPYRPKLSSAWGVVCLFPSPRRCTVPFSPSGNCFQFLFPHDLISSVPDGGAHLSDTLRSSSLPPLLMCS